MIGFCIRIAEVGHSVFLDHPVYCEGRGRKSLTNTGWLPHNVGLVVRAMEDAEDVAGLLPTILFQ